jgi:uncharacterized protein (TIGR02145 family)
MEGDSVTFFDLSTNMPDDWYWDFGDHSNSGSQIPVHKYSKAGTYTVSLTAFNSYGSDTKIKENYITVYLVQIAPIPDFTASRTTIMVGESVQFTDNSSNTPTAWFWEFGDGGTSTDQNPSHVYLAVGLYPVSLTASNSYGENTIIKNGLITVNESTIETGTFVDERDNHEYSRVKIGEQVWMAENLAYLPTVNPPADYSLTDPFNYVYGYLLYDPAEAKTFPSYNMYGVLYNWTSAIQYCPSGWHLPNENEWQLLINYLGGENTAGGSLKEAGYEHWNSPNTGADNSSRFSALPGGTYFYNRDDHFYGEGDIAYWWSSEQVSSDTVLIWGMKYDEASIRMVKDVKHNGNSIRCIKDEGTLKKQLHSAIKDKPILLKPKR